MEYPQISIIVPVYNAENYLNRCVDSILTQTFTDFEIILVNDGSSDNSGAICDEYALKDNRIKVIHKRNGGVSSARNIGIENSIGKWITFIDADDYIEAGFLNIPTEATEDLLIQNYQYFNEKEYVKIFKKKNISNSEFQNFINENIEEI
jgi:glycosyltransferase involved in cell wall biosynthesis